MTIGLLHWTLRLASFEPNKVVLLNAQTHSVVAHPHRLE